MTPLTLRLKPAELEEIRYRLSIEEPRVIRRANILNCLHLGYVSSQIAQILNVDPKTVTNVGNAYLEGGLESALYDEERAGRPIDFDDRERSRIVAMVCAKPPKGFYRWTLDLIVEQAQQRGLVGESISRETVRVLLKEHDLKPWQEKMWCIGQLDEEYIRRMEDVLDVYQRPHDPERPVVCVDEKPVPLISDQTPRLPLRGPGEVMLKDYEYVRGGSANVFCAVEPKAGVYINKVTESRDGLGFSIFMSELAHRYAAAEKITLVMDNLSTHNCQMLQQHLGEEMAKKIWDRFEIHHTPVHASWLNQAEIAIGMYSRQCLGDGRVGDLGSLKTKTAAWNKAANKRRQVIQWRFTTAKARKSMGYDLGQHAETLS
jgi:transposase